MTISYTCTSNAATNTDPAPFFAATNAPDRLGEKFLLEHEEESVRLAYYLLLRIVNRQSTREGGWLESVETTCKASVRVSLLGPWSLRWSLPQRAFPIDFNMDSLRLLFEVHSIRVLQRNTAILIVLFILIAVVFSKGKENLGSSLGGL